MGSLNPPQDNNGLINIEALFKDKELLDYCKDTGVKVNAASLGFSGLSVKLPKNGRCIVLQASTYWNTWLKRTERSNSKTIAIIEGDSSVGRLICKEDFLEQHEILKHGYLYHDNKDPKYQFVFCHENDLPQSQVSYSDIVKRGAPRRDPNQEGYEPREPRLCALPKDGTTNRAGASYLLNQVAMADGIVDSLGAAFGFADGFKILSLAFFLLCRRDQKLSDYQDWLDNHFSVTVSPMSPSAISAFCKKIGSDPSKLNEYTKRMAAESDGNEATLIINFDSADFPAFTKAILDDQNGGGQDSSAPNSINALIWVNLTTGMPLAMGFCGGNVFDATASQSLSDRVDAIRLYCQNHNFPASRLIVLDDRAELSCSQISELMDCGLDFVVNQTQSSAFWQDCRKQLSPAPAADPQPNEVALTGINLDVDFELNQATLGTGDGAKPVSYFVYHDPMVQVELMTKLLHDGFGLGHLEQYRQLEQYAQEQSSRVLVTSLQDVTPWQIKRFYSARPNDDFLLETLRTLWQANLKQTNHLESGLGKITVLLVAAQLATLLDRRMALARSTRQYLDYSKEIKDCLRSRTKLLHTLDQLTATMRDQELIFDHTEKAFELFKLFEVLWLDIPDINGAILINPF